VVEERLGKEAAELKRSKEEPVVHFEMLGRWAVRCVELRCGDEVRRGREMVVQQRGDYSGRSAGPIARGRRVCRGRE
jgi:hypothetical protein